MKKILWLTNIPSPYRVDFFNNLGSYCELTVLFEKAYSEERDDKWKYYSFEKFSGIIMRSIRCSVNTALSLGFLRYIRQSKNDIIVVGNPATPTGIAAILYMQLRKIPYIVESDGAFPKKATGIKGIIKKILYSRAKACFTTSELGKEYFLINGVHEENIYKYPFTSISEKDIPAPIDADQKIQLRKALGITEKKVVISVGRFIESKGFDVLLEAIKQIDDKGIGFYIVGDKPTPSFMEYCNKYSLTNVHFVDFMPPAELRRWYLAADIFALPTRTDVWGLVINEAMSCGLPVVTTNMCIAGTEMVSKENGCLINIDDVNALASSICKIIYSEDLNEMSNKARLVASQYTIEEMTERHIQLFNDIYG